jgi:interferon-induced GTP-binding protein Mx1
MTSFCKLQLADYEKTYRGRELPGFINYKTFEVMVKDQIKQLEEPTVKKLFHWMS